MATISERPTILTDDPRAEPGPSPLEPGQGYSLLLTFSEELGARLDELVRRSGDSRADVLNRAIGLYKAVSDAIREGKRVGFVDDPEIELDTEIVGL